MRVLVLLTLLTVPASVFGQEATFDWQTASPESQGMSTEKLDVVRDNIAKTSKAFLVIRNDKIVYEWYAEGHSATAKHYTASMAKAIVGGMSLAVAINDGLIKLDDPVSKFVPQWKDDPKKSKIKVRHLGSHTSGLDDANIDGVAHDKLPGWMGEFWKRNPPPGDPFTISRNTTPVIFEPGEKLHYSNPGIGMMTYAVTAAIKDASIKDVRTLLRDRIMRPIGVADKDWSVGYGQTVPVDGLPLVGSWGGGGYTARATARVGRLVLRKGDWDGKRLLSAEAIKQVTTDSGLPGNCGMGWWTNAAGRYEKVPKDAVWGAGAGDQLLLVIPSLKLIMVRNGATLAQEPKEGDVFVRFHNPRAKVLLEPLMDAIVPQDSPAKTSQRTDALPRGSVENKRELAPYPPSPVISQLMWAPASTVVRRAKGCDNWPLTWADDGDLYGAYGDGNGFEPALKKKLSLGLAKISGGPEAFQGTNLVSPSIEQLGEGAKGKKASGLVMVDGVLYMCLRNAQNAQLAWSKDHGQTWTFADWKWTSSFGCPTFLNYGRNYAGARDEFVYVYSSDSDSAYEASDRIVMARVPKNRIAEREAYQFFTKLDAQCSPQWTSDVAQRGAVFTNRGQCYRMGITYNAALKRYLWCHIHADSRHAQGPRFQGGFGIYDAPEPWGPWTTVYYTDDWDMGPGETSSFPTKWMSEDGKTLHLVFSGDDYFSVRAARLTTK